MPFIPDQVATSITRLNLSSMDFHPRGSLITSYWGIDEITSEVISCLADQNILPLTLIDKGLAQVVMVFYGLINNH